ncbi:hypothetical protein J6590_008003 [Homalodisca vitripennis]|nr:hypothetical protein J6590_008003 [Homalodisca vitripennis]
MHRSTRATSSTEPIDRSFLVANAQNNSCHIIYCSDGFCRLSGFSRAEVMQRPASCDFLHGPLTSQHAVNVVKEALAAGQEKHFEILYYRKDGGFSPRVDRKAGWRLVWRNIDLTYLQGTIHPK